MDEQGANAFATLLRLFRGPGAAGTTSVECRAMTPAALLVIYKVRRRKHRRDHFMRRPLPAELFITLLAAML